MAGRLTPAALRPAVRTLYGFARGADDIADDPALTVVERLARLDAMGAALGAALGGGPAVAPPGAADAIAAARELGAALDRRGLDAGAAREFLYALGVETTLTRVPDRAALMTISRMTAAPIGRLMLALHGVRDADLIAAAEALATALQLIDHVQDCGDDRRRLDRVYLPADWLAAAGLDADALAAPRTGRALRRVLDRCLDEVAPLLAAAGPLRGGGAPLPLALEAGVVLALAARLARRLRRRDPLARRVRLGPLGKAVALVSGLAGAALSRLGRGA